MSYRAKTVCDLLGIPRNTLLAWERRYGVPSPGRTDGGHRLYSDADVALLRRIKELLDGGLRIGEAVEVVRKEEVAAGPDLVDVHVEEATDRLRRTLLDRLLSFDTTGAEALRDRVALLSFRSALENVYLPLLREIGDLWGRGDASIAQEHFASAFCRDQMVGMLHSISSGPEGGPKALCAGAPQEMHEMGLLAIAIHLALSGWQVTYLGVDLPVEELCRLMVAREPDLVCQSFVLERPDEEILAHAASLARCAPDGTRIVFGGRAVSHLRGRSDRVQFCGTVQELLEVVS